MGERWAFAVLFAATGAFGLIWALPDRRRFFEFPCLISLATTVFLSPQIFFVVDNESMVPTDAFYMSMFHGMNCLLLAYAGYFTYRKTPWPVQVSYNSRKIFLAGAFVVCVGYLGYILMDVYLYKEFLGAYRHDEGFYSLDFRGSVVYLIYVARLTVPGLLICLIAIFVRPKASYIAFVILASFYPMLDVLIAGRRFMFVMLAASIVFPLYYVRRYVPSRATIAVGAAAVFAAVVILPEYRKESGLDVGWKSVTRVDVWGTFEDYLYADRTLEMPYQMLSIGAIFKTGGYGYGIDFYNSIIKQFVPRGLVGEKFKENFYLPGAQPEEAQEEVYGVSGAYYLSESGIIDSFWEFGFFGCILFFFTGRIWAWMYHRAIHSRDLRFTLAACLFAWVPPYVMYGGFLSTANRLLPTFVCFFIVHRIARIRPIQRTLAHRSAQLRRQLGKARPRIQQVTTSPGQNGRTVRRMHPKLAARRPDPRSTRR
jgi:hypothetical protein